MRVDEGTVSGAGGNTGDWGAEGGISGRSSEERGGVRGTAAEDAEVEEGGRTEEKEGSIEEKEKRTKEKERSMEEKEGNMEEREEKATPPRRMKTVKSRYPIIEQLLFDC